MVLGLLTSCGSGGTTTAPPTATAAVPAGPVAPTAAPSAVPGTAAAGPAPTVGTNDEAAVRQVFDAYNQALLARDFTRVCAVVEPTTAAAVQAAAGRQGLAAGSCAEAFVSVYANPQSAAVLDEASRNIEVKAVRVSGDVATITYSSRVQGRPSGDLTGLLRRVDGRWLVQGNS